MRVLSVQHYPVYGGPHNELRKLEPALERRGVKTVVAHTNEAGNAVSRLHGSVDVHQLDLDRIRMTSNPLRHAETLLHAPGDIGRLRRIMREQSIDLVKVHGPHNPHGAIAAHLEGLPLVWVVSSTRVPRAFRTIGGQLVKRMADAVLVTGSGVVPAYPGLADHRERIVTYYPPVDTDVFRPSEEHRQVVRAELGMPDGAALVGMVANLNPQKGIEYFIRAAAIIARELPETRFVIVGARYETQRAYEARVLAELEAAGLGGSITLTGERNDVDRFYAAMDVKLLTSVPESEGAPTTVIEAMSSGTPVVATDVGSVRELVEDGVSGFVVDALDVEGLAGDTIRLLKDPALRRAMGNAGRERAVRLFGTEICADAHLRAYRLALANHHRRARAA